MESVFLCFVNQRSICIYMYTWVFCPETRIFSFSWRMPEMVPAPEWMEMCGKEFLFGFLDSEQVIFLTWMGVCFQVTWCWISWLFFFRLSLRQNRSVRWTWSRTEQNLLFPYWNDIAESVPVPSDPQRIGQSSRLKRDEAFAAELNANKKATLAEAPFMSRQIYTWVMLVNLICECSHNRKGRCLYLCATKHSEHSRSQP